VADRLTDLASRGQDRRVWVLDLMGSKVVYHSLILWVEDIETEVPGWRTGCGLRLRESGPVWCLHDRGSMLPLWRANKLGQPCRRCWR